MNKYKNVRSCAKSNTIDRAVSDANVFQWEEPSV